MKKILLFLISLLSTSAFIFSQTTEVLHENFELPSLDDSVISSSTPTLGYTWSINTRLHYGSNSLRSDSCQVKNSSIVYLTSSSFSTLGFSNIELSFSQICKVDFLDIATIEVSNDGGTTWTQLTILHYTGAGTYGPNGNRFASNSYGSLWSPGVPSQLPSNTWWRTETFDLSTLVSNVPDAKIRFKLADGGPVGPNNCKGWFLDNIVVTVATSELIPPVITLVEPYPQGTIYSAGPFTIKTNITDASGIDTAFIVYSLNYGPDDTVGMVQTILDTMIGILPAMSDSDEVCWHVEAIDNSTAHNWARNPASNCIAFTTYEGNTFPFYDNFDINTTLWTPSYGSTNQSTTWQLGTPAFQSTTGAHSPPNAWDVNLSTAYNNNAYCILTSPVFDFSNTVNASMSFWIKFYTEKSYDGTRMEYTTNGSTWQLLGSIGDPMAQNWYTNVIYSANQPAWAGPPDEPSDWIKCQYKLNLLNNVMGIVRFRYIFTSDGSVTGDGFSIDDFSITLPAPEEVAIEDILSPTVGGCGMGNEYITIKIFNNGLDTITGGLTAGFKKAAWAPSVIEALTDTLNPGDTMSYTFLTPIDLSTQLMDSTFTFKVWVHLDADPNMGDDTLVQTLVSRFVPPAPGDTNVTINYGTSTTLTASSADSVKWYDAPTGGNLLASGPTYTTPILCDTTVYYPEATAPNGCTGTRASDTVFVGQTPSFDGSTLAILSPISGINLPNNAVVITQIKNFGTLAISNFTLRYKIDNQPIVTEVYSGTVQPGIGVNYTFNTTADLSVLGTYHFAVWIDVPGDANHWNDTVISEVVNSLLPYCTSRANSTSDGDIGNVTISNMNNGIADPVFNNNSAVQLYTDFTGLGPINLVRGQGNDFSLTGIYNIGHSTCLAKVFIDWDYNGVFDDATETALLLGPTSYYNTTLTGTINVPASGYTGMTLLRIVFQETTNFSNIQSCGVYSYGETEDYLVMLMPQLPIDAGIDDIVIPTANYPLGYPLEPTVTVRNCGTIDITAMNVYCQIDDGPVQLVDWSGNLPSGMTMNIIFPSDSIPLGTHEFCTWVQLINDSNSYNDTLCRTIIGYPLDTLPYSNDFEGVIDFEASSASNTQWILGAPVSGNFPVTVMSSPNVWCTNLNNPSGYSSNALCFLTSPLYNFTNVLNARLSFWIKYKTENNFDGTRLEYSLDNGSSWNILGTVNDQLATNWYTNVLSSSGKAGWAGTSNGWVNATYLLSEFNLAGIVRFRFVFTSDGTAQYQGFAVDDFSILLNTTSDISLEEIIFPDDVFAGDTINIQCLIKNLGNDSLTTLPLSYQINNEAVNTETWTATTGNVLLYEDTALVTFTTPYIVPFGDYILKVFTQFPGDVNQSNDTITLHMFGQYPCQAILPMLDTLHSWPPLEDSIYIHICKADSVHLHGFGNYPQNNNNYHQSDTTSTFYWDFGDGTTSTGQSISHHYDQAGGYEVRLIIKDLNNCYSDSGVVARVTVSGNLVQALHLNSYYCSGEIITVGYSDTNTIQLNGPIYSGTSGEELIQDSARFIPDGGALGGNCYNSFLMAGPPGTNATITSADQLNSIDINMEHSFVGDLQITLICPNGQSAILKQYIQSGGAFLGIPYGGINHSTYDCTNPPSCLSDPAQNPPGSGWTYSFSMDPVYQVMNNYASSGNCTPPPSSNVQMDSSSYMPDQSFSNLVGCPVSGTWTLQVCDYWAIDNGWVFWWKLNLSDSLLPPLWTYEVPIDTIIWNGNLQTGNDQYQAEIVTDTAGTYSYQIYISDEYGCNYHSSFSLNISNPVRVECSPDQVFTAPTTTILYCNVLQGEPPFTYNWSEGGQTMSVEVTTLITTTYYVTVTDANGCSGRDSVTVTIGGCPFLNGQILYHNEMHTPITGTDIQLLYNGIPFADTLTNNAGEFIFTNICQSGIYGIEVNCDANSGGYNAADALLALQSFVNMVNLTPLQALAGDVDGSELVNAVDALSIVKRFTGMCTSFSIGDWVFDISSVEMLPGLSQTKNIAALCAGDINGSYTPVLKEAPSVSLVEEGEIVINDKPNIEIPLVSHQDLTIGAISLVMNLPSGIEKVNDVRISGASPENTGASVFNVIDHSLYIGWYNLVPLELKPKDIIMVLDIEINRYLPADELRISLDPRSVVADENAVDYKGVELAVPALVAENSGFWLGQNRPNPFNHHTEFAYYLPSEAKVTVQIYNVLGELVSNEILTKALAGVNVYTLNTRSFVPGVYNYVVEAQTYFGNYKGTRRMIITE